MRPSLVSFIPVVLALSAPAAVRAYTWEATVAFPDATQGRVYAVGLNLDGTLLAVGGTPLDVAGANDAAVHYLPPGALVWSPGAWLNGPYLHQGAGIDALDRIVVFGGVRVGDLEPNPEVYTYDLVEGPDVGLAERGAPAAAAHFALATDPQRRVYAIGGGPGADATPGDPNVAYAERYDALADSWQVLAPLPAGVAAAAAVHDGQGRILVLGGFDAHATTRLANVWAYDITGGTWSDTAVPDMPEALTGHRAVLGADDRVYVLGGISGPHGNGAGTYEARVFVLDVAENTWSSGPDMIDARAYFGAVLGDDSHIYALGGEDAGTGVWRTERLYTPMCAEIAPLPGLVEVWRSQDMILSTTVTGGIPLSFQWQRDGADLIDGPSAGGGTISGATTTTLTIANIGSADAGIYALIATNPCGAIPSNPVTVDVRVPPIVPSSWTVTNLHPAGYLSSRANGVWGDTQTGYASMTDPTYGAMEHPIVWAGSAVSAVDMLPSQSVGASALAVGGDVQVGWWWWPYQCWVGGQWQTCYTRQACLWQGSAASHVNMQASGYEYSTISDTDGEYHAGTVSWDDASGNTYANAMLWHGLTPSWQNLHPSGVSKSGLYCLDGGRQFGWIHTPFPAPVVHAAGWTGTRDSFVDMHPSGASSSTIAGAGDGQQVGTASFAGSTHAFLWNGSAAAVRDLNPDGATGSSATGVSGGLQVGSAFGRAAMWAGTSESYVDLHPALPAEFTSSSATAIHVDGAGMIHVAGYGYNGATARVEALLWSAAVVGVSDAGDVARVPYLALRPNPSSGVVGIEFDLVREGAVDVRIFDVSGRAVRVLRSGALPAGRNVVEWDGRDARGEVVAPGVYFVQLRAGEERYPVRRVVRVR